MAPPTGRAYGGRGATTPARPVEGEVLKLYVDSTSLSLLRQVADFVACADREDVFKVATWLRLPLTAEQMGGRNAHFVPQTAAVSGDFVDVVGRLVQARRFERIEIHANQHHAGKSVVPLLRELCLLVPDARERISLDLYDDGNIGLLEREVLKRQRDPERQVAAAANDLRRAVLARQPLLWGIAQSYAWQHLFPTRYHLLRRDILLRDEPGRRLHAYLEPYAADMSFDGLPDLSPQQVEHYLGLFGLDGEQVAGLAELAADDSALLFTATGAWDDEFDARLAASQIEAIAALRADGTIPAGTRLAFKGHPANLANHAAIAAALGDDVVHVPARAPLELFAVLGLLPRRYGGVVSSAQFTIPADRLQFLLTDRTAVSGGPDAPLLDLMLESGLVSPHQVVPVLVPMTLT
nr:hypothetical protein [Motilibacter aurantiacus]